MCFIHSIVDFLRAPKVVQDVIQPNLPHYLYHHSRVIFSTTPTHSRYNRTVEDTSHPDPSRANSRSNFFVRCFLVLWGSSLLAHRLGAPELAVRPWWFWTSGLSSSMQLLKVIMGDQVPFDSSSKKCVTNGPTDQTTNLLTWVGARDACASKKKQMHLGWALTNGQVSQKGFW